MSDLPQQAFREEAYELLAELETSLLELEERPDDTEVVGQIFRAMHTIKGSGAMFGFTDISTFTHEVETVYDLVRNGRLGVSKALIEVSLKARDHIQSLLDACCSGEPADLDTSAELIRELKEFMPDSGAEPQARNPEIQEADAAEELRTWRIAFKPHPHILQNGHAHLFAHRRTQRTGNLPQRSADEKRSFAGGARSRTVLRELEHPPHFHLL